jgi:hypothetical protein
MADQQAINITMEENQDAYGEVDEHFDGENLPYASHKLSVSFFLSDAFVCVADWSTVSAMSASKDTM